MEILRGCVEKEFINFFFISESKTFRLRGWFDLAKGSGLMFNSFDFCDFWVSKLSVVWELYIFGLIGWLVTGNVVMELCARVVVPYVFMEKRVIYLLRFSFFCMFFFFNILFCCWMFVLKVEVHDCFWFVSLSGQV